MFDELNSGILKDEILAAIEQLRNGANSEPSMLLTDFFFQKKKDDIIN